MEFDKEMASSTVYQRSHFDTISWFFLFQYYEEFSTNSSEFLLFSEESAWRGGIIGLLHSHDEEQTFLCECHGKISAERHK
mmetsp:Transcript_7624/g.28584  ORF Transcript_7624/g.28584 Transcript_7624/m.28584 type:complete len:81 (+) Transcript_7624:1990-2232(+)